MDLKALPVWESAATRRYYAEHPLPNDFQSNVPAHSDINKKISFWMDGDITQLTVDAIVNPVDTNMKNTGTISDAIHRSAGPELMRACSRVGNIEIGCGAFTKGYKLPASHVLHASVPVDENPKTLRKMYRSILAGIDGTRIRSFGISCGLVPTSHYPLEAATEVALKTIREWLEVDENREKCDRIVLVASSAEEADVYWRKAQLYFPIGAMNSRLLKVNYWCEIDRVIQSESVFYDCDISGLLEFIKEKYPTEDGLCAVWKNGVCLDPDMLARDGLRGNDVFQITKTGDEAPEKVEILRSKMQKMTDLTVTPSTPTMNEFNPSRCEYLVVTNVTPESLLEGDKIVIDGSDTVNDVDEKLRELFSTWPVEIPIDAELHIFLPGGIPFRNGTMQDWYDATQISNPVMYVVVTKPLGELVDIPVHNICLSNSPEMQELLCPFGEATREGMAQMACLLGYIKYNGNDAELLLLALAKLTRFAPLCCNLFRILQNEEIIGLNIIAITAVLRTLFLSMLGNKRVAQKKILEYTLKMVSIISCVDDVEFLKLGISTWDDSTDNEEPVAWYCKQMELQRYNVVWQKDTAEPGFEGYTITRLSSQLYESIFNQIDEFKPMSVASSRYFYSTRILKGKRCPWLFIEMTDGCKVRYINPEIGKEAESDIDSLMRQTGGVNIEQGLEEAGQVVDQIVDVCFDSSISMRKQLDGKTVRKGDVAREAIARSILNTYIDYSNAYRIANILGLVAFNSDVKREAVLSATESDFRAAVTAIQSSGRTRLWDAMMVSCNDIIEFNTKNGEHVYPNAAQRILVISDGSDDKSCAVPYELVQKIINNNIIVDSIIISTEDENDELSVMCAMSGGFSYRVENYEESLELFERESIINLGVRRSIKPYSGSINEAIWKANVAEFKANRRYDINVRNLISEEGNKPFAISSPSFVVFESESMTTLSRRSTRLVRELKVIANHAKDDSYLEVWVNHFCWDKWRVFVKSGDKWWSLYVTFPEEYPNIPPVIYFLSVPYHPNVSKEGHLMFSMIGSGYRNNTSIREILRGVANLLISPELESPIQPTIASVYATQDVYDEKAQEAERDAMDSIDGYPYMASVNRFTHELETDDAFDDSLETQMLRTVSLGRPMARIMDVEMDDGDDY